MNRARVGREGLTWGLMDYSSPKPLRKRRRLLLRWVSLFLFLGHPLLMAAAADARSRGGDPLPLKVTVIDSDDIRFRKLSGSAGISQTRVSSVVQDGLGFLWFGTQYGLNRYDGYRSKAFKHEPGRLDSLGCVYIRSLFVDHSGTLWIGCDQSLDKYNPINETFTHYHVVPESPGSLPAPVAQFSQDRTGMLWLATARGLYRFDPVSGQSTPYAHDPKDPTSIAGNDVKFTGEDRTGQFWVAETMAAWKRSIARPEKSRDIFPSVQRSANSTRIGPEFSGSRVLLCPARWPLSISIANASPVMRSTICHTAICYR